MRRRVIVFLLVGVVLAGGAWFGYQWYRQGTATAAPLQTAAVTVGTISTSVSASGTIAAPQSTTLSWETTGVIQSINVSVGDVVAAGDVLAELDPASLSADFLQAQADLLSAQAELEDVLDGASAEEIAAARLAVIEAQEAVTTSQRSLNSALSPDVAYYQEQFARAQEDVAAAQATVDADQYQISLRTASDALATAKSSLEQWERLETLYPGYGQQHGDGYVNAQNRYARAVEDYNVALANVQQASIANVNTLTDAQDTLEIAEANLAAAQNGPSSTDVQLYTAELEQAQAELATAEQTLADLLAQPAELDIANARAALAKAEESAQQNTLVAPFAGTVLGIYNRRGDRVSSGATAIVLADLSSLKIQVSVSEVDVNLIAPGQAVSITVDAAPDSTYVGQVDQLIALGTSSSGVVTFPVIVSIPDPDPALKAGMSAAVNIIVAERAEALLVPNKAIRVANGARTVTVVNGGQSRPIEITIGLTNETYSEVISGSLQEGDRVVISGTATTGSSMTSEQSNPGLGGLLGGGPMDGGGPMNGGGAPPVP
ncbi:MAG: efflux RND transporter periplasmic adaptor subunit [Anaerolineales bacterium]|nr:efflux RND transporter periplasmic adaptor subunit [Anaerolineales bacterium]